MMKKISISKSWLTTSLVVIAFCFGITSAHAITTLLDENFDAGMPASASTLGGVSVNLRGGNDTINTYNMMSPNQRFSVKSGTTFFTPNTAANKFLVLGDDSGQLAGSPDKGTFTFAIPFSVAQGANTVTFSFDWVFKAFVLGSGTANTTDKFTVGVAGSGFDINQSMNNIVDQSITTQGSLQGPANVTVNVSDLGSPDSNGLYYLVFTLLESVGTTPTTNSGVGIDNIKIISDTSSTPVVTPPVVTPPSPFVGKPASAGNPTFISAHFSGSDNCASCHNGITDKNGADVSIITDWSSSMMANSSRDPFWRAKVRSETKRHPELETLINDKCTRCHAPMANTEAKKDGTLQFQTIFDGGILEAGKTNHDAAMNGVSCTLCHQIPNSPELGTLATTSGKYTINDTKTIYGPYGSGTATDPALFTMPMTMMTGYTPTYSPHVKESKLCASCHNLKTPYVDEVGNVLSTTPESEFPEQMPYTEWENSSFVDKQSCQGCHMSRTDGVKISTMGMVTARDNFAVHDLIGANKLMLDILSNNKQQLGVLSNNFAETFSKTDAMLKKAATVSVVEQRATSNALDFTLKVASSTGHKMPSAYPSRRAILHVTVINSQNQIVFESGKVNDDGSVVGVDADVQNDVFEPHYDLITSPNQVQVYEAIMGNNRGDVTYTLLRGKSYLKDNRILPTGFNKATAPTDVRVVGDALTDNNFIGGSDQIAYKISDLPVGNYKVKAELVYQTLSNAFAKDLFTDTTTPEVIDFKTMFDNSTQKSSVITNVEFTGSVVIIDTDNDGVGDHLDNCTFVANTNQRDTDKDGYGNACDADLNQNKIVDPTDLSKIKSLSGKVSSTGNEDLNGDGIVDAIDYNMAKVYLGKAPGAKL